MKRLRELEHEKYTLIQRDYDLQAVLEYYGLQDTTASEDITGAVVWIHEGEYAEVWLTEDNRWYDLSAVYRPVSFYLEAE